MHLGDDGFRPPLAHQLGRMRDSDEAHHAHAGRESAGDTELRSAGVSVASCNDADDSAAIFVAVILRLLHHCRNVDRVKQRDLGRRQRQPDLNNLDPTGELSTRCNDKPDLQRTKGHGHIGVYGHPRDFTGRRVHAARDIDRDDGRRNRVRIQQSREPRHRVAKRSSCTDADHSVENEVCGAQQDPSASVPAAVTRPPASRSASNPPASTDSVSNSASTLAPRDARCAPA